jgi:GTP-binding protein
VGKSTFFNRITRGRDALVDMTPGLTRDRRYARVRWNGCEFFLVDAGGLENISLAADRRGRHSAAEDSIEGMVRKHSLIAIEEADLILLVLDGRQGVVPDDHEVAALTRRSGKPVVAAVNKIDDRSHEHLAGEFWQLGFQEILPMGAINGSGTGKVMDRAVELLREKGLCDRDDAGPEGAGNDKSSGHASAVRIAIAGRPNAGKSSLLNALVRDERMIVSDIPGTTRDAIDTLLEREGAANIIFTDTAGIRRKARVKDRIEKFSAIKALDAVRDSDITLIVLDAVEGITDQDKRIIGFAAENGRACITIFNKWDLVRDDRRLVKLRLNELEMAKRFIRYAPHLNVSALTGKNVNRILPLADRVYRDFSFRAGTGLLNRLLKGAMARRNPPIAKGHHLKLFYVTQVSASPPTFVIFANYPDLIPEHYRRFLANHFREELDITLSPVRILFRQRERRK